MRPRGRGAGAAPARRPGAEATWSKPRGSAGPTPCERLGGGAPPAEEPGPEEQEEDRAEQAAHERGQQDQQARRVEHDEAGEERQAEEDPDHTPERAPPAWQ